MGEVDFSGLRNSDATDGAFTRCVLDLEGCSLKIPRPQAIRVLTLVLSDGKALDQALDEVAKTLPSDERAWLTDVCSGVLRWKTRLDLAIDAQSLKKKPTGWLRKVLLISAYQVLIQDRTSVPLVVSETVDLVRGKEGEAPSKFVNAALRRLAEQGDAWKNLTRPGLENQKGSKLSDRAAWAGLPEWWMKILEADHSEKWAMDFGAASLERPKLWMSVKADQPPEGCEKGPVPRSYFVSDRTEGKARGSITEWPGFREGNFFVQDLSSQLLVHEVTEEIRKRSGDRKLSILDRCAAPGGKSAGLSWMGWEVIATDTSKKRITLLEETVNRVAPLVKILPEAEALAEKVDAIWIDAPCSGSGIVRRHPDVRWLRKESDLVQAVKTQDTLIRDSFERLAPGGYLIYSVCSVFKREGEGVIASAGVKASVVREWRLAPHLNPSTDGFYCALIRK